MEFFNNLLDLSNSLVYKWGRFVNSYHLERRFEKGLERWNIFLQDRVRDIMYWNAKLFGYPDRNPGMKTQFKFDVWDQTRRGKYFTKHEWASIYHILPKYIINERDAPPETPESIWEILFGIIPHTNPPLRVAVEDGHGYYAFYFRNYKNIYTLPDRISMYLQLTFDITDNIGGLEYIREMTFFLIWMYMQVWDIRMLLSWFITINPYVYPWLIVVALCDFLEESIGHYFPSFYGVNSFQTIFLFFLGAIADSLNYWIFTMPYLPSEAKWTQILIKDEVADGLSMTQVQYYDGLPILWYMYPIPNKLREFWYYERPEILKYLQKGYKNTDIQFLPDQIVEKLNHISSSL